MAALGTMGEHTSASGVAEMTTWTTMARQRADSIQADLDRLVSNPSVDAAAVHGLRVRLAAVRHDHLGGPDPLSSGITPADGGGRRQRLSDWWTGNHVNDAWFELHEIEPGVELMRPDLDEVKRSARTHVLEHLPRRASNELAKELSSRTPDDEARAIAVEAINRAHRAAEARHEGERQRQRGVLGIATALLLVACLTLLLQAFSDDAFLETPSDGLAVSSKFLLGLVMLFGMLGGLVSALFSLYVTDKSFADTIWFDPRPMLTVAKVISGLWTAVIGILAVGSGLLVGVYTSLASALLLAFLFGYGQQAVTGFLDRKVVEMTQDTDS